mgnify:CR=1 FL=1|tara:strand:+ start:24 stop:194 length:171 start_codon:yes stop_codon:yes gene_type:complete
MNIKRYNLENVSYGILGDIDEMVEREHGEYVLFDDVYEVVEKYKKRLAELEDARSR